MDSRGLVGGLRRGSARPLLSRVDRSPAQKRWYVLERMLRGGPGGRDK